MIKLYKDGDSMGITTDAKDEGEFIEDFSKKIAFAIEEKIFEGDWEFQFVRWLPQFVDICCKYKGYKSTVKEKRVLFTGDIWPDDKYVVLVDRKKMLEEGQEGEK